jgi:DNA-directed RNA polymerase subunit M/transcription elongation factor TFIIS
MTNKEKDILALFNELNSMLYEVLGDCNKALSENIELKKEVAWYKKYTDTLVEHKDMVCLPADLKNLREANAALATENEELKKIINRYRNDPNAMLEPTEEELNSLFMDKQIDPKDIEFEAEMLVKSVEEAASKLKSIKEHNNLFTKEISFSTGIACPKCGSELMYVDQNLLLSSPPQRRVQCSKCNHIDYIFLV